MSGQKPLESHNLAFATISDLRCYIVLEIEAKLKVIGWSFYLNRILMINFLWDFVLVDGPSKMKLPENLPYRWPFDLSIRIGTSRDGL